jgi:hypothetical protein
MPIPSTIADLSTTAASNSPLGSEPPTEGDNHIRALASIIKQESQFTQEGTGAVERTREEKHQDFLDAADFGAVGDDSTDNAAFLQAWIDECEASGKRGYLGPGIYRTTVALEVPAEVYLSGQNMSTSAIVAGGCNAIRITGSFAGLRDIQIRSATADFLTLDPRSYAGIYIDGAAGDSRDGIALERIYMQGWEYCIDAHYTWSSLFDSIHTVNCEYGIRLHEQSVNNSIRDCKLVANSGVASLVLSHDVTAGEGLMVSNCLMASGDYGVHVKNFFLSVSFTNCILDLCGDRGIYVENSVIGLSFLGGWIYAANYGVYFSALGSPNDNSSQIQTLITTTDSNGVGVFLGDNNKGVQIGGTINCAAAGGANYAVNIDTYTGGSVSFGPLHIVNTATTLGVRFNGADIHGLNNITGVKTVTYVLSPIAGIPSAATVTLPRSSNNTYSITGTTGITSITATGWDGETVTLIFSDTLTVTDGSNLKLAGNFSATDDDVLVLVCDGTDWYEVSRSNN